MANNNVTPLSKRCTKCGIVKPIDKYHRAKVGLYRRYSICKKCKNTNTRQYLRTEAGKQSRVRANKKYYKTKKGKQQKAKDQRIYNGRYPAKHNAHWAVARAVKNGILPKASDCDCRYCGKTAKEYHHHRGYDQAHRCDVIPLCKTCHQATS